MRQDLNCPVCDADVPLTGDEKPGSEVFCAFCRAPLTLAGSLEDDDAELEEDF